MGDHQHQSSSALIFLHIPKTAGSTLHSLFNKRYPAHEVCNIFATSHADEQAVRLRHLSLADRAEIKLLKGHMPFGLHEYLPGPSQYFTVLRDPVKHVISQYFYIKNNPDNPLCDVIRSNNWSLGEFIESGIAYGMNNSQVRWLRGNLRDLPFGEIGESHLQEAINNLSTRFIAVGINEMFDQSLLVLASKLAWKKMPYYLRMNTNKKKAVVSEEDISIIRHYNQYDIRLYEHGVKMLEKEIKAIPGFEGLLETFQLRNNIYSKIRAPFRFLPFME